MLYVYVYLNVSRIKKTSTFHKPFLVFETTTCFCLQVDPKSPASGSINNGDAIVAIGGTRADSLTHMQAHQLIKSAGNHLQMTVLQ